MRLNRNKSKRSRKLWILFVGLGVCLILSGGLTWLYVKATDVHHVEISKTDEELGIKKEPMVMPKEKLVKKAVVERNDIVNIALFGVDRRDSSERGRSDSIMIATVDFKHDKIKLTSLMRDLHVPIDGYGSTKLNHAYAYGGAELAIKTINQNFGTDIRDYATVDFFTLEKIIDSVGGVDIDVKENEVSFINKYMEETALIQKKKVVPVSRYGKVNLNGMQAVSYARIRKVGNGDFERTERQRVVLSALISKVKDQGASSLPQLFIQTAPLVETSLSRSELTSLAYEYFKQLPMTIQQERYPKDGDWHSEVINKAWYMTADLKQLKEQVHSYIYEDNAGDATKSKSE